MSRALLRLSLRCNNRCIFCAQDGLEEADPDDVGRRLEDLRADTAEVTFTGGEPTVFPDLVGAIKSAHALGFRRIGIQTNGRKLADPRLAQALALAGLTDVHVSLHGANAAAVASRDKPTSGCDAPTRA